MADKTTTRSGDRRLIVVTGSNGLIGSRLVHDLAPDFQVVGLDLNEPEQLAPGTRWMPCDLTDEASVDAALTRLARDFGTRIASVIHLAAYYDFSGKPSPMYRRLTVEGTRRLIRGLRRFEVEQFVFTSSLLVMEPRQEAEEAPLDERSSTQAEWDYPRSKLAAERVLKEERFGIPVVILRLAGVYDEQCHSLPIGQQIRRIYERKLESYFYPGDASHGQPFIHLNDVATCIHRVVNRRHELGPWDVFLVAETGVLSYADLQERLGRLIHGREWPAIRIPKPVAKAGAWLKEKAPGRDPFIRPWMIDLADDDYRVTMQHAAERLGWQPRHRLADSLGDMVDSLKRAPRAWYELNQLPLPRPEREPIGAFTAQPPHV